MAAAAAQALTSQIEFFLTCSGLPKLDVTSNTDPFVVVYVSGPPGTAAVELGRTETIMDTNAPEFTRQFSMNYHFEEIQTLRFDVYDRDSKSEDLSRHDFVGTCTTTVGNIMGHRGALSLALLNRGGARAQGNLHIRAEERHSTADRLVVRFAARNLDKKDFFGKSDPFIAILRVREDGARVRVWESEVIKKTLNPDWAEANIPIQTLCNGDLYRPIQLEVWDWNKSGTHDFIGVAEASVDALLRGQGVELPLINAELQRKKGARYSNSGVLVPVRTQYVVNPTMLDYIVGGCEMSLIIGIDFTASNGAPSTPGSLHYRIPGGGRPNAYQQAIYEIGSIVGDYDTDKRFPVYGFGGQLGQQVSHCFPLTLDPTHVEVDGIAGVMAVYNNALDCVGLSGPTLFAPLISRAMEDARDGCMHGRQRYTILLIITDGVINDMAATVDAIIAASSLPLSIIIVGVGAADFSAMDALDSDDKLLSRGGRTAARDIVQFVPLREFEGKPPFQLAKSVLAEVPEQFMSFMRAARIAPNPRPAHAGMARAHAQAAPYGASAPPAGAGAVPPPSAPAASVYPPAPLMGAGAGFGGTV